jgi:hypothetical protein
MKTVLFHRDFRLLSGGHVKVWHYFQHFMAFEGFSPRIFFTPESSFSKDNPWHLLSDKVAREWAPYDADLLFLAGLDWASLAPADRSRPPRPVLNLIQGVRHATPDSQLYHYLENPAVRICVSQPVADAIEATGKVNGPIHVIPAALDFTELPQQVNGWEDRERDVLILAIKNREFGRAITDRLARRGFTTKLVDRQLPRSLYLNELAKSRIGVFLPLAEEGFYLPPLEAMALDVLSVCPDCVGNREYLRHESNGFIPAYTVDAIFEVAEALLESTRSDVGRILNKARDSLRRHCLYTERAELFELLSHYEIA